ncbi:MAG: GntR family transcriptional regulator [Thermomicrobiales bacterium]|nr:GntR family transcriptional regulator [Thermomicrobiales bacterium]
MVIVRDSATPLYEQLKGWLRDEIAAGGEPGRQLPSERQLVERFGVSRITVRKALADLVGEGVVYSVPGRGFFVGEKEQLYELHALRSFSDDARERGQEPSSRVLEARLILAAPAQAFQLDVPAGTELVSLRRVRLLDGAPAILQHVWLPHAMCPDLLAAPLDRISLYAVLAERYSVRLTRGRTAIAARLADPVERVLLELPEPSAVLTVDQVTYDRAGRPVELLQSSHNPKRYPLSIAHSEAGGRGEVMRHGA